MAEVLYCTTIRNVIILRIIHSFIHYMNVYSASSKLLHRSSPDFSTVKKSSFKARVECVGLEPNCYG